MDAPQIASDLINELLYEWYAQWPLKDWFTYKVYFEWPCNWPLHNDSELALSERHLPIILFVWYMVNIC
jgi:hypothetical protein